MSGLNDANTRQAQSAIIITNANASVNTAGASHHCRRALIRSHPDNSGVVWIDINTAAVVSSCWPLNIGDALEVSIRNTDKINVILESGGDKVTVLYED